MVGAPEAAGMGDVICWVAATVAPLFVAILVVFAARSGGGAGGTRGGGADGRCGSVIVSSLKQLKQEAELDFADHYDWKR